MKLNSYPRYAARPTSYKFVIWLMLAAAFFFASCASVTPHQAANKHYSKCRPVR